MLSIHPFINVCIYFFNHISLHTSLHLPMHPLSVCASIVSKPVMYFILFISPESPPPREGISLSFIDLSALNALAMDDAPMLVMLCEKGM